MVAPVVAHALEEFRVAHPDLAAHILVAGIPPELADTAAMTEAYGMELALSVNCILVLGRRGQDRRVAACAVRATTRADVNHVVKQLLDVRKASFMSQDDAVAASGMEYGGITPIGLPRDWRLLVDARVVGEPAGVDGEGPETGGAVGNWACIGSGLRSSKLFVPGAVLAALPGAEVIGGLATEV